MNSASGATDPETGKTNHTNEASVLATVVSALAGLDQDARLRIFRTLATFFDLPSQPHSGHAPRQSVVEAGNGSHPSGTQSSPSFSEDRNPSPKAFLLEKRPQTDVERVACLAYYLTHYRGQAHFKTLELSKLNTEAAQVKFSNAAKAVDNAAGALLLIPAGQGKKQLSAIGEVYVQALPDRAAAKIAASELRQKRTRNKSKPRTSAAGELATGTEAENGDE